MCRCRICYFNVAYVEGACHKPCASLLCILKNCIHVCKFQIHNEDRTVKIFLLALWWEAWFYRCLTWYVKSWHGSSYGSLAVLLLKFISELHRFWFMCGYYFLIKPLHGNMIRFSACDRGSIDQISPSSIAPYVYAFWMNVLGTGTPSLSHLLYICDKNYPIPSYIIVTTNGIYEAYIWV